MNDSFLYTLKTSVGQSKIKDLLDRFHRDCSQVCLPVFLNNSVLQAITLDSSCAKQVYRVDQSQVFRWDQTRPLLQVTRNTDLPATRCFGPVFRRGPRGRYRWRQFYQYDADYNYQLYGLEPIGNLARFFRTLGPGFHFKFNHMDGSNPLDLLEPVQGVRYLWDPSLKRDHSYYRGVVFQVYHPEATVALAGGGVYMGRRAMIGYGVGVTRLCKLLDQGHITLPEEPLIGVYVHQGYPSVLLQSLCHWGLKPYLLHKQRNLRRDSYQAHRRLKPMGFYLKFLVIHGPSQQSTGLYRYRFPGQDSRDYTAQDLCSRMRQWIDSETS